MPINLTLGTLAQLKGQLLNISLQGDTDFDAALTTMGLGVAARFAQYCNRIWPFATGQTYTTNADRMRLILPAFPIVQVTKVEVRDDLAIGFVDQGPPASVIFNLREEAGLVEFAGYLGGGFSRLRLTYDGGYWFDATDNGSGSQPTGSTLLPADLQFAWLLQCEWVWNNRDRLGVSLAGGAESKKTFALGQVELVVEAQNILKQYVRFSP